jgi:hypothetical protein
MWKDKGFYVYLYLRANQSPYYIGKGKGSRAIQRGQNHWPPKDRSRITLIPCNAAWIALAIEKDLIRYYGRKDNGTGILRNQTDGGDAPPISHRGSRKGHKKPLRWRQQLIARNIGNKYNLGKKRSEETKRKIGAANAVALKGNVPWNKGLKNVDSD